MISKLAKDKISSEGKGLSENRTSMHVAGSALALLEKKIKNFRWIHLVKYTMIFIQLYMQ